MTSTRIPPSLFAFLRELKAHNDRSWFEANKARYHADVRDPMLAFIDAFAGPLSEISPHFRADPRPHGGSLFRIYRDTRFSKDKTPYKTNVLRRRRPVASRQSRARLRSGRDRGPGRRMGVRQDRRILPGNL